MIQIQKFLAKDSKLFLRSGCKKNLYSPSSTRPVGTGPSCDKVVLSVTLALAAEVATIVAPKGFAIGTLGKESKETEEGLLVLLAAGEKWLARGTGARTKDVL